MRVGADDALHIRRNENGAVHFRQLVEMGRRIIGVNVKAALGQRLDLRRIADDNEPAGIGTQHIVQSFTQRCAWSRFFEHIHECIGFT